MMIVMKLEHYLKKHNISVVDFSERVGVSPPAVYLWLQGRRIPTRDVMLDITTITKGVVTANDFYYDEKKPWKK
jgi:transcriptional regulator with XRE-family HTH domain